MKLTRCIAEEGNPKRFRPFQEDFHLNLVLETLG